jgi:hypothetical protein
MSDHESPIFVFGAPRSGTTLLRLILNAHPKISIPEEMHFFKSTMFGAPIEMWERDISLSQEMMQEMHSMLKFMANDTGMDYLQNVENLYGEGTHFSLKDLYGTLSSEFLKRSGKERWGEKTPENILYADIVHDMFPSGKFIIMRRDPRAVISSMNDVYFYPSDTGLNLLNYIFYCENGYSRAEKALKNTGYLEIYYEDLISAPEQTVKTVCSFLGEDYDPAMLDFHLTSSSSMSGNASSFYNQKAKSPISKDSIDSWKEKLSPADQFLINQVLGLPDAGERKNLSAQKKQKILAEYEGKKSVWREARDRHQCHRDFQIRNPGQAINSNIPSQRLEP